ncbi:MAG: TonB-dependent receptor family protein [Longimicrobiales bacterium]
MIPNFRPLSTPGALLALLALCPPALEAQEEAEDTVTLNPVVVTVLRSPTLLDEVPFSASVLAGEDLTRGSTGLFIEEALHTLPGVRVQNRYNPAVGERISIRGFGARAQFGVRGIKVLVDGIPATLPDGQATLDHLDIGSLGRVEALRGPAAALYGNGAGGVLSFQSTTPFAGRYQQTGTVVVGSDGLLRLQASGSGSQGGVGYRASVAHSRYDGFRDNLSGAGPDPYSGGNRTTINGGVVADLGGGTLNLQLSGLNLDALNGGSLPADVFGDGSNQAWGFNIASGAMKQVKQGQLGASWQGDLGGLEGAFSAYGVRRQLDNPIPGSVIDLDRNGGGVRAALAKHWSLPAGEASLNFGVETELQDDDRRNFENDDGAAGALTRDQQERVRAAGLFAQMHLPATERVSVMGAVRYENVNFSAEDRFTAGGDPDDSGDRSMSGINPSIGLHVDLGDHGLFASVARSFETPTTTELANRESGAGGLNPDLDPQRGWSVEGGVRGQAGLRATYDLAAFSTWLTDQLVPFEVASSPGRSFFRNAGESRLRGVEASTRVVLTDVLTGSASYSYVDAEFTDFTLDGEDFSGNRVPGIAPHQFEGGLLAQQGPWFGEARIEVRGAVPTNDENDAEADGFTLLDLRVGGTELTAGSMTLSPYVGITNVTDTRYASSVVVNAFGGRYFEPGPDRGFYVGMTMGWSGR